MHVCRIHSAETSLTGSTLQKRVKLLVDSLNGANTMRHNNKNIFYSQNKHKKTVNDVASETNTKL